MVEDAAENIVPFQFFFFSAGLSSECGTKLGRGGNVETYPVRAALVLVEITAVFLVRLMFRVLLVQSTHLTLYSYVHRY